MLLARVHGGLADLANEFGFAREKPKHGAVPGNTGPWGRNLILIREKLYVVEGLSP